MEFKRPKAGFALIEPFDADFVGPQSKLPVVKKHAFTLIELLIVIAVIAVLISMLLPTLQQAKYITRRASCLSNVVQQQVAQMSYAANNRGQFSPRIVCGADYARVGDNSGPWYGLTKTGKYMPDLHIMVCPLTVKFGGLYANPNYYYPQFPDYGGWGAGRTYVISPYAWFANYRPDDHVFAADEPPWPKNTSQCDKSRAFISHRITFSLAGGQFDDWGHLGSDRHNPPNSGDYDELATSPDQPVGYADGHVEIHLKSQVRRRTLSDTWWRFEWYY